MAVTDKLKEMVEELRQDVGEMKQQLRQLVAGKESKGRALPVRRDREDRSLGVWERDSDRLFEQLWRGSLRPFDSAMSPFAAHLGLAWPQIDVDETDREVRVVAELPGMDSDDVQVTVANGVLTIRGEKRHEDEDTGRHHFRRECFYGQFARSVPIPSEVDVDRIQAKMKKGKLRVTLPKVEGAARRGRTITINS